jgi:uridine kinase
MTNKGYKTVLVGIAGASGSGKTYLAHKIINRLKSSNVIHMLSDNYYKDSSHLTMAQRNKRNYDHRNAIDFPMLTAHLKKLKKGLAIDQPVYDFSVHNRTVETVTVGPAGVVLLDGILILAIPELRELLDLKIYIETPLDVCFIRRMRRDLHQRGRTVESVMEQYLRTVRPMFLQFVNPSKVYADVIIAGEGSMDEDTQTVVELVNKKICESH